MIAKKLKDVRTKQFLSQQELANRSGVSRPTIAHLEKGRGCHGATIRALAVALGVEASELVEEERKPLHSHLCRRCRNHYTCMCEEGPAGEEELCFNCMKLVEEAEGIEKNPQP